MTLKGRKNHFNVKLLAGYGLSVSIRNNRIVLKNGSDPFSDKQETEEWFITRLPYEKLVISGRGYLSLDAIELLCTHNKNIVITDSFGHPVSFISGMMDSMTASRYRMAQYDAFRDEKKRAALVKETVLAKLDSQIRFLDMLNRDDAIPVIEKLQEKRRQAEESSEPVRVEASAGNLYFRYYSTLFDSKFGFESRNQSSIRITKRNASDPINALLNYGYSVLAGEISKFVNGFGLDAYYGYMHKQHTGFQPLVYDIIEPFRWVVELAVYRTANDKTTRHNIQSRDYAFTKNGSVVLSYHLKRVFLNKLERIFQQKREYKFKFGRSKKNGMNNCEEITICKLFIENYFSCATSKIM